MTLFSNFSNFLTLHQWFHYKNFLTLNFCSKFLIWYTDMLYHEIRKYIETIFGFSKLISSKITLESPIKRFFQIKDFFFVKFLWNFLWIFIIWNFQILFNFQISKYFFYFLLSMKTFLIISSCVLILRSLRYQSYGLLIL